MPTIAMFLGILIKMQWREHLPPHFHAWYSGHEATFDLDGKLLEGEMPRPQQKYIAAWAELRKAEILADWEASRNQEELFRIRGFE